MDRLASPCRENTAPAQGSFRRQSGKQRLERAALPGLLASPRNRRKHRRQQSGVLVVCSIRSAGPVSGRRHEDPRRRGAGSTDVRGEVVFAHDAAGHARQERPVPLGLPEKPSERTGTGMRIGCCSPLHVVPAEAGSQGGADNQVRSRGPVLEPTLEKDRQTRRLGRQVMGAGQHPFPRLPVEQRHRNARAHAFQDLPQRGRRQAGQYEPVIHGASSPGHIIWRSARSRNRPCASNSSSNVPVWTTRPASST